MKTRIAIIGTILSGAILYLALINLNERPEPKWIEEPNDNLMDYEN